jgi:hypothetical protein
LHSTIQLIRGNTVTEKHISVGAYEYISRNDLDNCLVLQLPPAATWQMLRDKFRDCGDVKYAEMRTKDIGLVRFSNDWDAERAVRILSRHFMSF